MLSVGEQPDPYTDPKGWRTWARQWNEQEKLDTLHPRLRTHVRNILTALRQAGYTTATINYGWRHPKTQASLQREGSTTSPWSLHNGMIDTPGVGWTAAALAADIYWPSAESDADRGRFYQALRALAHAAGLKSGADFKSGPADAVTRWAPYGLGWDPPHVEAVLTDDEKAQARNTVLTDIHALLDPQEIVYAIPDDGRAPYAVSWLNRTTTLRRVARDAVTTIQDNTPWGTIAALLAAAGAAAILSGGRRR